MKRSHQRRFLAVALCTTLSAILVLEWRALGIPRSPDAEYEASIDDDLPASSVPQYSVPNEDNFVNVVERMLFTPGRRPAELRADSSSAESVDDMEADNLELVAIMLEGEHKLALLRNRQKRRESTWVGQGDIFRGWTVAEIDRGGIQVTRGDLRTDIYLRPFQHAAEQERPGRTLRSERDYEDYERD